jgi:hypothetical protein
MHQKEIIEEQKKKEKELIENAKLLKPLLEKNINVSVGNSKILGPLSDKLIVKNKIISLHFVQQNFNLYNYESVGYCIVADSILVGVKGKLPKNKSFELEFCAFDKNNNPVFYNTIFTCATKIEIGGLLKTGRGVYYCTFRSEVLPFESEKTREMAFMDLAVFEQAKSFNLVSRYK